MSATTYRQKHSGKLANLNSRYLYGLTATPKRKHNDEQFIFVYIGDIAATMDTMRLAHNTLDENIMPKAPQVIVRETELEMPFQWKKPIISTCWQK